MTRPREIAEVEELADELERWSSYAEGARTDAETRHQYVSERVRRAQRATLLATESSANDQHQLVQLERSVAKYLDSQASLVGQLAASRERLTVVIEEARSLKAELELVLRDVDQALTVTTTEIGEAVENDELARTELHRALDHQLANSRNRFRRSARDASAASCQLAEQAARWAAARLADARVRLADLRGRDVALRRAIADLDNEVSATAASLNQLDIGDNEAMKAHEHLTAAATNTEAARSLHESTTELIGRMNHHVHVAGETFRSATHHRSSLIEAYELVQHLTIDAAAALRDLHDRPDRTTHPEHE